MAAIAVAFDGSRWADAESVSPTGTFPGCRERKPNWNLSRRLGR